MRWDEQRIDREDEAKLPGITGATGVIRRFDAPEALGIRFHEVEARSALNRVPKRSRMPFRWTVNPYRGCSHACVYCFARPTHTYLDLNAAEDFEREIVVKVNVPEVLRAELAKPRWGRELVAFGTNTDPYQWVESRYELMPPMLDALAEARTPVTVLTKSSLALRDIDPFKRLAEVVDVSVNFSIPTLDEKAWRETEPHTPSPRKRIEAVAELNHAGIPSGVLIAPLMPGINDAPEQVEEIVSLCREAGASFISGIGLHLRPGVKEVFMDWLRTARPDLVDRYEQLYSGRSYLIKEERARVSALLPKGRGRPRRGRGVPPPADPAAPAEPPEPLQPSLF
jgi:DNA repair photolyase